MRFAAQHPELVRQLVLLVSAHGSPRWMANDERQFEALERSDFRSSSARTRCCFSTLTTGWFDSSWKDQEQLC
jgi:pimeloyl-ACP methyl ester carboxylesterase